MYEVLCKTIGKKGMDESWYEKMEKYILQHICVHNILEQNAQNI